MRPPAANRPRFADADAGAQRTSLIGGAVALSFPFAFIGYLLCLMFGIKGWLQAAIVVGVGLALAISCVSLAMRVANGAGRLVARFLAPSGSTTPYEYSYSYQQALAAKGDLAGALESYEAVLRESPHEVEACLQAAELFAKNGNVTRAMQLFRSVRVIPGVSDTRAIYASNRLIDLYIASNDEGRALVELRRVIESHPGTDTAVRARAALGRLKAERSA